MSRRWTFDELCHLRRLAAQGIDAQHIADALDRSVLAIRIKAAHLRIALPEPDIRHGPAAFRLPLDALRRRQQS